MGLSLQHSASAKPQRLSVAGQWLVRYELPNKPSRLCLHHRISTKPQRLSASPTCPVLPCPDPGRNLTGLTDPSAKVPVSSLTPPPLQHDIPHGLPEIFPVGQERGCEIGFQIFFFTGLYFFKGFGHIGIIRRQQSGFGARAQLL